MNEDVGDDVVRVLHQMATEAGARPSTLEPGPVRAAAERRVTRRRRLRVASSLATLAVVGGVAAFASAPWSSTQRPQSVSPATTSSPGTLAPAVVPTTTPVTPTQVSVLFLGRGVGIVSVYVPGAGCGTVLMTTDFTSWQDVTPILSTPANDPCAYGWQSAAFVSPKEGWLLGRNGGSTNTVLEHTVDGGRTWTSQPGGSTGSNGGDEVIGFVDSQVGWRKQFAYGSNAPYTLELTHDGGMTWTPTSPPATAGGCQYATDVFASPTTGFASSPLPPQGPPTLESNIPSIWRTTDGGTSWSTMTVPFPPTVSAGAQALYGQPTFLGAAGTLPVVYLQGSQAWVAFYETADTGTSWSLLDLLPVPGSFPTSGTPGRCGSGNSPAGSFPSVALVDPNTWWVLDPATGGQPQIMVTSDEGAHWTSTPTTGLPVTSQLPASPFQAVDASHAFLSIAGKAGSPSELYETADGGQAWKPADPSTSTSPTAAPPAIVGELPATVPAGGVQLDQVSPPGHLNRAMAYLYPPTPSGGELDRTAAIKAVEVLGFGNGATVTAALLADVTLPGTVPSPGEPAGANVTFHRAAWVTVSTYPAPIQVPLGCAAPCTGAAPTMTATELVQVIDAHTGQLLIGYFSN